MFADGGFTEISIHALREEGDGVRQPGSVRYGISIHALREEGDGGLHKKHGAVLYFYPRPPRGGRLLPTRSMLQADLISIHALREEGDPKVPASSSLIAISIHALREEGDQKPCTWNAIL